MLRVETHCTRGSASTTKNSYLPTFLIKTTSVSPCLCGSIDPIMSTQIAADNAQPSPKRHSAGATTYPYYSAPRPRLMFFNCGITRPLTFKNQVQKTPKTKNAKPYYQFSLATQRPRQLSQDGRPRPHLWDKNRGNAVPATPLSTRGKLQTIENMGCALWGRPQSNR
jgi:hypothetical protein